MKKAGLIIGISLACLILIVLFLSLTGILSWYKNPTPSNEPAIKDGEIFCATILKKDLQRGNYIVYTSSYTDSISQPGTDGPVKRNRYVKRMCGIPGDLIEMRNGIFFVNKRNFDKDYDLKAFYTISRDEVYTLGYDLDKMAFNGDFIQRNDGSLTINLTDTDAALLKEKVKIKRYIETKNDAFNWLGKTNDFTVDNFGPIKIPPGCYFLLGDNRHNSLDSRYTGFITQNDIKSVVLWK